MSQPYQTQISGAQILRFTIASVNRKRSTYPTLPVQEITNILSEREKTLLCEKMYIHSASKDNKRLAPQHSSYRVSGVSPLFSNSTYLTETAFPFPGLMNPGFPINLLCETNCGWGSCCCTGVSFALWQTEAMMSVIIALLLSDLHTKPTVKKERPKGNSRDMSNQMLYFDWPIESQ